MNPISKLQLKELIRFYFYRSRTKDKFTDAIYMQPGMGLALYRLFRDRNMY